MTDTTVVPESREMTRDVSVPRLHGTEKTNGHHRQHHQHHLHKPRVPPKHAGLVKNGLSQNSLVHKVNSKDSMKETSVALTRLLCGEDVGKDGGEADGCISTSNINRDGGNNRTPPTVAKRNGSSADVITSSISLSSVSNKRSEDTEGGSFSETVARSPVWGHHTNKVKDSSVVRSKSFNYGAKKNGLAVLTFRPEAAAGNRGKDGCGQREGKREKEGRNSEVITQHRNTGKDVDTLDEQLQKMPSRNISVRQQWMAKRRSLSNSPNIGAAHDTKESKKDPVILNDAALPEVRTTSICSALTLQNRSAGSSELMQLSSGIKVGRKKLSVRNDESRHHHNEMLLVDGNTEMTNIRRASESSERVSAPQKNGSRAESGDHSLKAYTKDETFDEVTIISGNLKGSQKGKVVYVDRKHLYNSWTSGSEIASAGPSAVCADQSFPFQDANSEKKQGVNVQDHDLMNTNETALTKSKSEVKVIEGVKKAKNIRSCDKSLRLGEESSLENKTLAATLKQNQSTASIKCEGARNKTVNNEDHTATKKISENKVDSPKNAVCDKDVGQSKKGTSGVEHMGRGARSNIESLKKVASENLHKPNSIEVRSKKNVCDDASDQYKEDRGLTSRPSESAGVIVDEVVVKSGSKESDSVGVFGDKVVVKSIPTESDSGVIVVDKVVVTSRPNESKSGVDVNTDVVNSPKAAAKTIVSNKVIEINRVNGREHTDYGNSMEMKTFKDINKSADIKIYASVTVPSRISSNIDAQTSAGTVNTTNTVTTLTPISATTKTPATPTDLAFTIICDSSMKIANGSSSGSEKEKVYANEDSLPNSPQNVPEEGTTPTENIEITDLDFFKTDIVRSSHCKRNGFPVHVPSNSPKQVREVAVATTSLRESVELTSIVRPPAGKTAAKNACVTVVEVHHQPPAKKHTVDIVIASNARALDSNFNTATSTNSNISNMKGSRSHPASPRAYPRLLREISSSSSSRESSPEKKGDLAGAVTSSQDEKNRAKDSMAAAGALSPDRKNKAKEPTLTSAPGNQAGTKDLAAAVTSSQDEKNRTRDVVAAASTLSQDDKKSKGEPILKPKARTKTAKSVSFEKNEMIVTDTPETGFQFQLGILKECESQVQTFLEDADSVLAALDQCQAEEKCLMLIKRPKDSAKKMLKSHSLANLSVSDPQLYRQFSGLQLAQLHQPVVQSSCFKDKRSSDEQSVTSSDTARSDQPPRRRYVSSKENLANQHQHHRVSLPPDSHFHNVSGDYSFGSDTSSAASDYQYAGRRDRRGGLRYSSIPEDDTPEINNNNRGGEEGVASPSSSLYHSCHDVSLASRASSGARSDRNWGQSQDQGQVLSSDQMYGRQYQQPPPRGDGGGRSHPSQHAPQPSACPRPEVASRDPGDMEEGSRSQSLGNLSTGGLTLSLVGQRKADSMLDLASPTSPQPLRTHHPPPRTHAPDPSRRSEGYPQDFPRKHSCHNAMPLNEKSVRSPRHSYPDTQNEASKRSPRHSHPDTYNVRTPRAQDEGEPFPPPPSGGYYNNNGVMQSPSHQRLQTQYPQGNSQHPSYAGGMPRGTNPQNQQHQQHPPYYDSSQLQNGYSAGLVNSSSRGETTLSEAAPPKPKRNLPHVPLTETSEKIKRFTEMMKSRMTVSSRSTVTPQTPTTPLSRQLSVSTDNGSDCEISNLLDNHPRDASCTSLPPKPSHIAEGSRGGRGVVQDEKDKAGVQIHHPQYLGSYHPPQQSYSSVSFSSSGGSGRHVSSASTQQETPNGGDGLSESGGPTSFTSHSHSSTMDSGYTTNNECDADSSINSHHLHHPHHPHPHHMLSPPHLHKQSKPLSYQQQGHLQQQQAPPYQRHAQHGDAIRPVPVPRNLSLSGARKYGSMQNVHSQQTIGPEAHHTDLHNAGDGGQTLPHAGLSQSKVTASARAQQSMNGYDGGGDHGHHPAVLEHQRRSWDLAQNFKSLDFVSTPLENVGPRPVAGKRQEDGVVRPQAVSVSGNSQPCSSSGSSPAHRPDPQRRDSQQRVHRRSSWQEVVMAQERASDSPPPLPAQPPPALEASAVSTLPGHWKFNPNHNSVGHHSNSNSGFSSCPESSKSSSNQSTPQRTPPKLKNIDTAAAASIVNTTVNTSPTPSLFQLSQQYDLQSLRLTLPPHVAVSQLLTVNTVQVTLPAGSLDASSPPAHSPQGRTAKLGGPGSAFRKVESSGGAGQGVIVELTAVAAVEDQSADLWTMGPPRVGDLIVEINGRQCIGWDVARTQEALKVAQGDVLMGVARRREEQIDTRMQQLENSLKTLEHAVQKMKEELAKKDARILELSTMLPWKREDDINNKGDGKLLLESEEGAFVIGDNEFVV